MTAGAALQAALDDLGARIDTIESRLADAEAAIDKLGDRAPTEPVAPVDPGPEPTEPGDGDSLPDIPPALGDEPIAQFLTHDGVTGPSRAYWNYAVQLRWRNPGVGDWRDATGAEQGEAPYATAAITKATGPYTWDVTSLAQKQAAPGENRGFFLRAAGTLFAYQIHGRTAADEPARPLLTVVTDRGTFECRARATARWSINSINRYAGAVEFRVQQNQTHAIVQWDYSPIPQGATIISATMTLHITGSPRAGRIDVFEADPPRYILGRGDNYETGLAAAVDSDAALRGHPAVILVREPQESEPGTGTVPELMTDSDTGLQFHRCTLRAGQHEVDRGSIIRSIPLVSAAEPYGPPTSVEEEVYFRYRVRYNEDWRSTVDSSKSPGIDMGFGYWAEGGYWQQVSGNGGIPGTGRFGPSWHKYSSFHPRAGEPIDAYHGHMSRGHAGQYHGDGNPYGELFLRHSTYAYHLDPADQNYKYGETFRWGNSVLQRGRWHDIEHHVKVNSLVGEPDQYGNREAAYDGIYEGWVDGHLVFRKTDFRWRRHPLMGIESIWLGWYHGGQSPSPITMHVDIGSIVIAREYIGPTVIAG